MSDSSSGVIKFSTGVSGGSERMRIRSDGFVGIGNGGLAATRLSVTNSVVGVNIETTSATAAHEALIVNRQNSDGIAIAINKAGATVGSIGTAAGPVAYIVLNDAATDNVAALKGASGAILPSTNAGADKDGTMNLGSSGARFESLYLSDGVVFGDAGGSGTPASNTLDSYEEGSWTPVMTASAGYVFGSHTGRYTKIGNVVTLVANFVITTVGTSTSNLNWSGAPFLTLNVVNLQQEGVAREVNTTGRLYAAQISYNDTVGQLNSMDGITAGDNEIFIAGAYSMSITYIAAP
jgi:hypothetical protein